MSPLSFFRSQNARNVRLREPWKMIFGSRKLILKMGSRLITSPNLPPCGQWSMRCNFSQTTRIRLSGSSQKKGAILLHRRTTCNFWGMSTLLCHLGFGSFGRRPSAKSSLGLFFKIEFGRRIGCIGEDGQIVGYANYATKFKKRPPTSFFNVGSRVEFGPP